MLKPVDVLLRRICVGVRVSAVAATGVKSCMPSLTIEGHARDVRVFSSSADAPVSAAPSQEAGGRVVSGTKSSLDTSMDEGQRDDCAGGVRRGRKT